MLALTPIPRLPRIVAAAVTGAGLLAIGYATLSYSATTPFPGSAALVPTLGAAAVIAGGSAATATVPARLLSIAPMQYVGAISYSLYLWHWPLLIFAAATLGPLAMWQSILVVAFAFLPSAVSYRWVEEPFRRSRGLARHPARAVAMGSGVMCVSALGALILVAMRPHFGTAPVNSVKGAAAITEEARPQKRASAVRPNPLKADDDRGQAYDDGCLGERGDTKAHPCEYGSGSSRPTVVLFGDSHAMMYFPALMPIAEEYRWRVITLLKRGCTPALTPTYNGNLEREYTECESWRDDALRQVAEEHPDLVVVTGATLFQAMQDGQVLGDTARAAALERGYAHTLRRLRATGAKVAAIQDIPEAPEDIPDCVSESLDHLDHCAFSISKQKPHPAYDVKATEQVRGARLVNMTPAVCRNRICRAVIGNALVYRGTNHLTATFARTLAPRLWRKLPKP